ncbi:unnamed protein product [Staurois parvus]|uniref:Ribonuclease A-domain domain-containing protein n=1 Tax=Staurois parvus TaxID=386267 RepID=A0ABN9ASV2_9NEOB|nr:unnamed protein product [Staurois parvus]
MVSKVSSLLIFGIFLCVLHWSECQNWIAFRRKHIAYSSNINCTNVMNRYPFRKQHGCKQLNTFIHAPAKTVQNICRGVMQPTDTTSIAPFRYTTCVNTFHHGHHCVYKAKTGRRVICVTCERRSPVHFVKVGQC